MTANDVVWDQAHQVFYVAVPSTASNYGNCIAVVDPVSATVVSSTFAGSEPNVLAISDDDSFLYVGLRGSSSVQRFLLPSLTQDISFSLGTSQMSGAYYAVSMAVAPGAPRTVAISLNTPGTSSVATGGTRIFDDGVSRPEAASGYDREANDPYCTFDCLYDQVVWGSDATQLYAVNYEDSGFDFYTMTVSAQGITQITDYPNTFSSFSNRIHFNRGDGLIYSDDGHVVTPSTGQPAGQFPTAGPMLPDSALARAIFAASDGFGNSASLDLYDLSHFTATNQRALPSLGSTAVRLVRWGNDGLALQTRDGALYLMDISTLL